MHITIKGLSWHMLAMDFRKLAKLRRGNGGAATAARNRAMETLGSVLRELCASKLSEQGAAAIGLSDAEIQGIQRGEREVTVEHLVRWSQALGVEVWELLLGGTEQPGIGEK